MAIDAEFLDHLVCPKSRAPMIYFAQEEGGGFLFCPDSKLKYRVVSDLPVLLVDEAEQVDDEEAARLLAEAEKNDLPRTGSAGS